MATITRGSHDASVEKVKAVLDEYERLHPGAVANLYRQNSASIRIRVIDERFAQWSKGQRHDYLWKFITDRLSEDDVEEISVLLPLSKAELRSSFMNSEFDDPIPSSL